MNLSDIMLPPPDIKSEKWQLGRRISGEISAGGIALVFVSDYRGAGLSAENRDFNGFRHCFYRLSNSGIEIPIADLGDLVSGNTAADTHFILQEIISTCLQNGAIPIVLGGGADLTLPMISALNSHQKNIVYTLISNCLALSPEAGEINNDNYLNRILSAKELSIKSFHLLGYQKFLNDSESVKLLGEVDFDVLRLAEMMGGTARTEPFFRKADVVTLDCNALESFDGGFSVRPQVNGLNRREVCAYMKEAGLSENLKAAGIFNFNFGGKSELHCQLLAQMVWYLAEGISIQRTHPQERDFETFFVMVGEESYAFHRDTFRNLWYFGAPEDLANWLPCAPEDFENAKRGIVNPRFFRRG